MVIHSPARRFAQPATVALLWALASGAAGCMARGAPKPVANPSVDATLASHRRQQVVDLLKSMETGKTEPVAAISPTKYIQHNLAVADGVAGLGAMLARLPAHSARVNTLRAFEDGDFVFTHTEYDLMGPKVGFDVFRFEGDKIVEHWDNLQERPERPNPSGHTMTDGPMKADDLALTYENKQRMGQFVNTVFVQGQIDKLADFIDPDHHVQHDPEMADNLAGLKLGLENQAARGRAVRYDKVEKVLGEGNFVLVMCQGTVAGKEAGLYDLFRVQGGKAVEHWNTVELIPAQTQWKNTNGKF